MATTEFGFAWGNVAVTRCFEHRGTKVIRIAHANGQMIDVVVSPSGRRITTNRPAKLRPKRKG